MTQQRKRIGPLDTAGSVATENAKVYKELRRGRIEPSLASRLSQILINQTCRFFSFQCLPQCDPVASRLTRMSGRYREDSVSGRLPGARRSSVEAGCAQGFSTREKASRRRTEKEE